jgi:hypothetical protein
MKLNYARDARRASRTQELIGSQGVGVPCAAVSGVAVPAGDHPPVDTSARLRRRF